MHSFVTLTDYSRYRIHERLAEAEHEHLVRRCTAGSAAPHAGGWGQRRLVLGALAAVGLYLSAGGVLAAPAPETISPPLALPTATAPDPSAAAGCWATGDLVGNANPATITALLCGSTPPSLQVAQP
jgi:hypothetical protein